jgi:hypothetical protein
MFLATSWLAMTARNLFRVSFHGLGGLHLLIKSLLHLLESFFVHGREVDDFDDRYRGRTGGSGL